MFSLRNHYYVLDLPQIPVYLFKKSKSINLNDSYYKASIFTVNSRKN